MLQIATGKFARDVPLNSTKHRIVLYTNAVRFDSPIIETVFGNLMPASVGNPTKAWVVETTEKLEAEALSGENEIMISTGGSDIASDFAVVLSFVLNLTFTTSEQSLRNLISSEPSEIGVTPSNKFLARTFDESVYVSDEEVEDAISFMKKLWLLERTEFKVIVNGMRRYVLATHRMKEEPSLAYALLVMAIEAIEQNITEAQVDWADIEEAKRSRIDAALKGASADVSVGVREAICDTEKVKASAKFREFVLSNIAQSYFRSEAKSTIRPPSKNDLKKMLQSAYQARSRYVHELKELDNNFLRPHDHAETVWAAGSTHLSFQGLARLVRHVIRQRLFAAEEHPEQQYNYRNDLPNVAVMQLASHYWIHKAQGYGASISRRNLSACLDQVFQCNIDSGAAITDQSEVMQEIEKLLPSLTRAEDRNPMVAHYFAYNWPLSKDRRCPKFEETAKFIEEKYGNLHCYTFEFFAVDTVLNSTLEYSFDQAVGYWQKYVTQRHHKNGLNLPHRIEAAILLNVAELAHKEQRAEDVALYVSKAVEAFPGQSYLLFLEENIDRFLEGAANWRDCFFESQRNMKRG